MQIIEQFSEGKAGNNDLNEDRVVVTPDFIAVLDGATSRAGHALRGLPNGKFAAKIIAEAIEGLDPKTVARDAVDLFTETLLRETKAAAADEGRVLDEIWAYPAAAALIYSVHHRQVWRIADSTFVIDGRGNYKTFPQEKTWVELRRAYLHAQIARGRTEEDLLQNDPSWSLLTPLIGEFKIFANYDGPYGYGVINGTRVPDAHVEVYPAPQAVEIIFASDGYTEVEDTLAGTEKYLKQLVADDPLMYRLQPQVKGVRPGHASFDDRSYIRFRP